MKTRTIFGTVALVLFVVGCTNEQNLSRSEFDERTYKVEVAMSGQGYYPVAFNAEVVNEGGCEGKNREENYMWYDRRSFADSLGRMAEYTMRYQKVGNRIVGMSLIGCSVFDSRDYNRICGHQGAVHQLEKRR